MKAIIEKWQSANGEQIQLMGVGADERAARIAAFATTHHGHNDFDQEYTGGTCVDMSEHLASLNKLADKAFTTADDQGNIVAIEAVDPHAWGNALMQLYIRNDKLDTRFQKQ